MIARLLFLECSDWRLGILICSHGKVLAHKERDFSRLMKHRKETTKFERFSGLLHSVSLFDFAVSF
jgi:hypothetical protein